MKSWPTLYKKNKNGSLQQWNISIYEDWMSSKNWVIETRFGQVDGQIQETRDIISKGKNVGKKNETLIHQQTEAEAQARWEKNIKKGYVEDLAKAKAGEDDIGGVLPMLAHKWKDHGHKLTFPVLCSRKLDGIRCIAIVKDGKATLWSRTRKPITSCPHIVAALEDLGRDLVFDGELYRHELKDNFEAIVSAVRKEEPTEESSQVQYHVFDVVNEQPFALRADELIDLVSPEDEILKMVLSDIAEDEGDIDDLHDQYLEEGYEGIMIRDPKGLYEHRRSYGLLKHKKFEDAEFQIVGVEEGRGKLAGHAIFQCITPPPNGTIFSVKLKGDLERLKEFFENPELWKNKFLTVRYQGLTNAKQVPRFPVGVSVRDYE